MPTTISTLHDRAIDEVFADIAAALKRGAVLIRLRSPVAQCALIPNVAATADMYGAFGCLQLCGTAGYAQVASGDSFFAFKAQLAAFIAYLRTGVRPFPFAETIELMQRVIAGIRSREQGGREISLEDMV